MCSSDLGTVAVQATSQLTATGEMSARGLGATAKGGTIELTAPSVSLQGATADASGAGGGGAVRIGGGYQGSALSQGGSNAISTSVDAGTTLRADATGRGDGGQVVVWSEKATQVDGTITARGGSQGGNGGLVETSKIGRAHV